ncbi:MAG: hypothetical protein Q8P68_02275 [Candidatus Peregrinibacteria bacterium]|nr:hypothetical protein [Candidatus Peregrinibacteria bacterium]MDZ4244486.1 hypothetical protein [Candidatus Gracilibacteria bacterium]
MKNLTKLSDKGLLALCKEYGEKAIHFRRKFIGLLPEMKKRKLFEKKKCKSIYEFAAKYGGVSREHVDRVVNLSDRFVEKPLLHSLLVNGEISSNKLAKIASIVDLVDEIDLVEAVRKLSCRTVETYVRDVKSRFGVTDVADENQFNFGNDSLFGSNNSSSDFGSDMSCDFVSNIADTSEKSSKIKIENGLFEPSNNPKSVHVHKSCVEDNAAISQIYASLDENIGGMGLCKREALPIKKLQLKLSEETLENLLELQEKGISVDKLFKEFLQKHQQDLAENKVDN